MLLHELRGVDWIGWQKSQFRKHVGCRQTSVIRRSTCNEEDLVSTVKERRNQIQVMILKSQSVPQCDWLLINFLYHEVWITLLHRHLRRPFNNLFFSRDYTVILDFSYLIA